MHSLPADLASTSARKPPAHRASTLARANRRDRYHDEAISSSGAVVLNQRNEAVSFSGLLPPGPPTPSRTRSRTHAQISGVGVHSLQFWKGLAVQLDQREAALQSLLHERDRVARQERFSDAALLSRQVQELQSEDIVAQLRADQICAVEQQDFIRAAALKKARLVNLLGWWQIGPLDKKDVRGHVMHVSEAFGKLVGRVYSASDLAKIFGCTAENHLGVKPTPELMSRLGTAVFEVILHSGSGAVASIQHQPFFLPQSISALRSRTEATLPTQSSRQPVPFAQEGRPTPPHASTNPQSKPVHERSAIRRPKFPQRRRANIPAPSSPSLAPAAGLESARASLERSLALDSVPDVPVASGAALTTVDEENVPESADMQCLDGLAAAAGLEQHLLGEAQEPQTDEDIMAMSLADARRKLFTGAAERDTAYMELPAQPLGGVLDTVDLGQSDWATASAEELPTIAPRFSMATVSPARLEALLDIPTTSSSHAASFSLSMPDATAAKLQYTRMDTPQGEGESAGHHGEDPLTGYFLGSYGSNGSELLQLQRGVWQGRPAIIAHKVTGDEHVPAGHVSFRVHTDTAEVRPQYQAIMGSTSVLQGEGCATVCRESGETSWMDGELVVFGPGATQPFQDLAGGAQLGFIWSGSFHRRFLILLTKLPFSALQGDA